MDPKIEDAIYRLLKSLDRYAPPPQSPETAQYYAYREENRERRNAYDRDYRKRREVNHAA